MEQACDIRVVGELGDLGHLGSGRAPWIVTRRCKARSAYEYSLGPGAGGSAIQSFDIPSRTFTWTLEYPLVTFLTLRITFDILAVGV